MYPEIFFIYNYLTPPPPPTINRRGAGGAWISLKAVPTDLKIVLWLKYQAG